MKNISIVILFAVAAAVLATVIAKLLGVENPAPISGGVAGAVSAIVATRVYRSKDS
ncbi:MAG: hypothetical protein QGI78_08790 [Phycisphaerales bacterium]|nr:hypothetical protein [Phycisphaerales bacterium]